MPTAQDLTNRRFGRLTALEFVGRRTVGKQSKRLWRVMCDCGTERILPASALTTGNTKSCGCLLRETITKHGGSKTHLYAVWHAMLSRCRSPSDAAWSDYGGRGIKVCKRWNDFGAFLEDMGAPPRGYSLDRIDVDGDYKPANCRWATPLVQANNRRNHRRITYDGQTHTLAEWARRLNVSQMCLYYRLGAGWPVERALTQRSDRRLRGNV